MLIPENKPVRGWWFGGDFLPNGDGRAVTDGCVLRVDSPIVICSHGLHFGRSILDALGYAMGATVWRVEGWGEAVESEDKLACEHRRHLWRLDIDAVLRRFACREALRVLPADAPACVREYLALADKASEEQMLASWYAARSAASTASWYAARAAAGYAARDEAWSAAGYAAGYAARSAARSAAGYAAGSAAREAALDAARTRQARSLEAMVWAERRRVWEKPPTGSSARASGI